MPRLTLCRLAAIVCATACGDGLLDRQSSLSIAASAGVVNSPNCTNLGNAIEVLSGFTGQQLNASIDLQVDNQGDPVVAWLATRDAIGGGLHVNRWKSGAWVTISEIDPVIGILDTGNDFAENLLLRFGPSNRAYVAWPTVDTNTGMATLHVLQSDGGSWSPVPLWPLQSSVSTHTPFAFGFDINANGAAAIAWFTDNSYFQSIYANADPAQNANWMQVGVFNAAAAPSLLAQSGNATFVAWSAQQPEVARASNGNFLPKNGPADGNFFISGDNAFVTSSTPGSALAWVTTRQGGTSQALAWEDDRFGTENIYYRQGSDTWDALANSDTGAGVSQMTTPALARHASMTMDANNHPVVAYEDVTAHQVVVRTWDGVTWSSPLTVSRAVNGAWWPKLAANQTGQVFVTWEEDNARIWVCRLR